jgi:hypothetical protein
MHPPLSTLDEDAWDDLLNFIEERRVIPIIGPELLTIETDAGSRLLYEWIAEKLAAKLNVDTTQLPQPYTLNDVVCWFLSSRGRREEAYTRLRSILREANFAPPPALRRLAQITDFNLFVTTTFDPLLEQAINAERFGGAQSTEVIAYAPNRVAGLADRARSIPAARGLPPAGPPVRVAHLRDLGRGHAGIHLRAAKRAPDAGKALPRTRAQPPALHRQQLHQLARAAVPAHGQAPPPVRPARRGRSAGRQPLRQGRPSDGFPAAGQRAHAHLQRRRELCE